jgi:hypothetical protein
MELGIEQHESNHDNLVNFVPGKPYSKCMQTTGREGERGESH